MKNNAFKHTLWIGVFIITMSSLLAVLIGVNVYGFLEDKISLSKNTPKTEKDYEVDNDTQKIIYVQVPIKEVVKEETKLVKKVEPITKLDSQPIENPIKDTTIVKDSTSLSDVH